MKKPTLYEMASVAMYCQKPSMGSNRTVAEAMGLRPRRARTILRRAAHKGLVQKGYARENIETRSGLVPTVAVYMTER